MAAMHPFAGLDGDPPRPAGSVARPARPVPAPASLRRLEPLAAVFCGLHGVLVLAAAGGDPWQWAGVGLVLLAGLAGVGGRGPAWMVPVRAGAILVVGVALQASTGAAGGWFLAWPFVLVAVYPLALPGPAGMVVAGLAVLGYVLVVRLAGPPVGPALAVAHGVLLAGLAGLAWTAARAYARMASLAVEAELELGRRERLGRAVLDALPDPTSVLDGHGRVVAANRAWARAVADGPPGLALAEVGQSYPAACAAAASAQAGPDLGARLAAATGRADPDPVARLAAGHGDLAAAADGVRAVLGRELPRFRCRYLDPGGTGPYEVAVTALPEGDGALVTHRPAPAG
jgi:PAS domain-containing protein